VLGSDASMRRGGRREAWGRKACHDHVTSFNTPLECVLAGGGVGRQEGRKWCHDIMGLNLLEGIAG
jgi:hypothetical protein